MGSMCLDGAIVIPPWAHGVRKLLFYDDSPRPKYNSWKIWPKRKNNDKIVGTIFCGAGGGEKLARVSRQL